MKKFKKIFAAIAASALVAAMSFTSMAASITITSGAPADGIDETTYTYYEMLKASISGKNVAYYVETDKLANAIRNLAVDLDGDKEDDALFTVSEKTAAGNRWNVTPSAKLTRLIKSGKDGEEEAAKKIAAAFKTIKDKAINNGTFDSAKGTADSGTLEEGYYLVESSLGTVLAVATVGDVRITEKNSYPSLEKTEKTDTASYGDKIEYTVTVRIPESAAAEEIRVVDSMTSGLTPFDSDADNRLDVKANVGGNVLTDENAVTVSETVKGDNGKQQITITIPAHAVNAYKGQDVVLTYYAVLNNSAVTNVPESNTAYLEYANYTSIHTTPVDVKTYDFVITKVDGDNKFIPEAAGDAEFTLYKTAEGDDIDDKIYVELKSGTANTYQVTRTESNTKILAGGKNHSATIEGLAAGTYYLQEDKAPTGYNKLTGRKQITVLKDKPAGKNNANVQNNAGIQLPSTGGMGTTVFAIVGLLVMAGAAVTLIVKKRA